MPKGDHGSDVLARSVLVLPDPKKKRQALLADERFFTPGYYGPYGWVGLNFAAEVDWDEVAELVDSSFRNAARSNSTASSTPTDRVARSTTGSGGSHGSREQERHHGTRRSTRGRGSAESPRLRHADRATTPRIPSRPPRRIENLHRATTERSDQSTPWEHVDAPPDCMCSDGSPFAYFVHRADPHKVLFFLEGGGACFDAWHPDSDRYTVKLSGDTNRMAAAGTGDGLLDVADARNPLRDYSIVYVPYCTGDVHLGDSTTDYGNGVVVQHKGAVNSSAAMAVKERFPTQIIPWSPASPRGRSLHRSPPGCCRTDSPEATITVVADGSGGYPNEPGLVSYVGGQWGTFKHVPDWPETTGMTPEQWNFAQLYVASHRHDPDIVFTRHDFTFDRTRSPTPSSPGSTPRSSTRRWMPTRRSSKREASTC